MLICIILPIIYGYKVKYVFNCRVAIVTLGMPLGENDAFKEHQRSLWIGFDRAALVNVYIDCGSVCLHRIARVLPQRKRHPRSTKNVAFYAWADSFCISLAAIVIHY